MSNLYAVLNVSPQCSMDELKSAYRRCARQTHPDRQGDAHRFQRVQEAYAVLGDPQKRALYDQARRAWMQKVGASECPACGQANRIPRLPQPDERVSCSACKATLRLTFPEAVAVQRQSLAHEAARLIDELGMGFVDLTADALRAGLERLRRRLERTRKD